MDTNLELEALPHPDPRVQRLGFDLTHPYVEQCWGAVIGPSGIAILRRLPVLWTQGTPARIPAAELARTLGLGPGVGEHGRFHRALDRLTQFRLAEWTEPGRAIGVYTEVAPLGDRHVARVPEWTQVAHGRLLDDHLNGIAAGQGRAAQVTEITTRLDQLQRMPSHPIPPTQALGR